MWKFLILLIILVQIAESFPKCQQVEYSYFILALTWPPQFCSQTYCKSNWQEQWDSRSMTIHGFWPSSTNLAYLSCLRKHKKDPYCTEEMPLMLELLSGEQRSELEKYWPQLKSNKLWAHEWQKHGTCYMHLIKESGSPAPEQQVQRQYFLSTMQKVKSLNIKLEAAKIETKADLGRMIGVEESQFWAICRKDDQLDEIRICYSLDKPGQEQVIDCPPSKDHSRCNFPIWVP